MAVCAAKGDKNRGTALFLLSGHLSPGDARSIPVLESLSCVSHLPECLSFGLVDGESDIAFTASGRGEWTWKTNSFAISFCLSFHLMSDLLFLNSHLPVLGGGRGKQQQNLVIRISPLAAALLVPECILFCNLHRLLQLGHQSSHLRRVQQKLPRRSPQHLPLQV